uniref:Histone H4 n=1 Tax=Strongyloides papillosus TaxID=174720 RepID=A0A0N5BI68_STREA
MPGRGKGGKGHGKDDANCYRKVLHDNTRGITNSVIRCFARRVGAEHISRSAYEETRTILNSFLKNVIHDPITYYEHAKRKTVTAKDVVYTLKRREITLYGFRV